MAIIEYKNEHATLKEGWHNDSTYKALAELARRARIPFYVVLYSSDFRKWFVLAGNEIGNRLADVHLKDHTETNEPLTEAKYVDFLYILRGETSRPHIPLIDDKPGENNNESA